jgi:hypothetical protein
MLKWIAVLTVVLSVFRHDASAQTQYAFDVKTPLTSKYELQIVKQGILLALDESPTARVQEFREDYSLWLTEVQRYLRNDSLHVVATVELRGPAGFRRGTFFAKRKCRLRYHWSRANAYARTHFADETLPRQDSYEQTAESIGSMMVLTSGYRNPIGSLSGAMVAGAVVGLGDALSKNPSPIEVMESVYIGRSVLWAVQEMVAAHPR